MRKAIHHILSLLLLVLIGIPSWGQRMTSMRGIVYDAATKEALPFVQVVFLGTTNGTVTDFEGRFSVSNELGDTLVVFKMMGYQSDTIALHYGKSASGKKIYLHETTTQLPSVVVTPNKKKERYSRKDNPAVELARKVISYKDSNQIHQDFSRRVYDKTTMALDDFHPDFKKHKLWKHLPFVEKYIDTTEFDETEILNISIHECLMQQEYSYIDNHMRTLTIAQRSEGLSQELEAEDIDGSITSIFAPVDIYSNSINLVSNQFVGPLSEGLAITFYHYYITDTIVEDNEPLIELSFAPARPESYGFIGRMYITLDGSYAVRRVTMKVSAGANVNFVHDLTILQTFERDSLGQNRMVRCDTYGRMAVWKKLQQLYIHQLRNFSDYRFADSISRVPDTLFSAVKSNATLPNAHRVRRKEWNLIRPIELRWQETVLDSFRYELAKIPSIKFTLNTLKILGFGYIYSNRTQDSARFMIGPIYNFVSHNNLEGYRIRIGGQSTARLNPKNFFNGYVAYGCSDQRPKGNIKLIHTFEEKKHQPFESPLGMLILSAKYEVESPGLSFAQFDPDNILMQAVETRIMQYVGEGKLTIRRQWGDLSTDSWIATQHYEPANALKYVRYTSSNGTESVETYWNHEISTSFSFAPNRQSTKNREGKTRSRDRFSLSFTHTLGLMDGFFYNNSTIKMYKQFWMSPLGNIDLLLTAGKVWNQVPLPKLIIPDGNASFLMTDNSFNTMRPMEYIVDQHISLFTTYHMRGLILSHIPFIKKLKLREVFSFNMLYGNLTDKNNPSLHHPGLYAFPSSTQSLGKLPYMEYSIGIENILKIIRIDYVARITYLQEDTPNHGWRLGLRFTL